MGNFLSARHMHSTAVAESAMNSSEKTHTIKSIQMGDLKHCHTTVIIAFNNFFLGGGEKKEPGFHSDELKQDAKVTSEASTFFVVFRKSFTFDSKAHLVM